ncbi:DgyrCDS3907 [Dimorphilus gyrociliatus]|uniref:DgyrCDS3907 n=1 Tax=Dimorphilus gyrociliatus TaxID=2664684 RepID=A0A7I8VGT2_9ANNE|nr:DgyrCDS3907 [Dimorphilus gyrociliatus]
MAGWQMQAQLTEMLLDSITSNRRRSANHRQALRDIIMEQHSPAPYRPALTEISTSRHHVVTHRPSNWHNIILDTERASTVLAADEDIIQQRTLLDRSLNSSIDERADEAYVAGSTQTSRPSTPIVEEANTSFEQLEVNNNSPSTAKSKKKKRRSSLLRLTKSPSLPVRSPKTAAKVSKRNDRISFVFCEDYEIRCCDGLGCFTDEPPFEHLPAPWCPDRVHPQFLLYTRRNPDSAQAIERDYIPPIFDGKREKTVFIVHGYLSSEHNSWVKPLIDGFLSKGDFNVIFVDWSSGSIDPGIDYPLAASNTRVTGAEIALIAKKLQDERDVDPDSCYCVGHSLGAHACGFAGKRSEFGRITGLDPAGPWWIDNEPEARLDKGDATLVDCIHTHGDGGPIIDLGIGKAIGHIDFFPNLASMQPGCLTKKQDIQDAITCSHHRAIWYYKESLTSDCKFTAVPCKSKEDQQEGLCRHCQDPDCNYMGFRTEEYANRTDVGYNGIPKTGFVNNVLNAYFTEYFPRAAEIGEELRRGGYLETFTYTTHPWLVSMYVDCPPNLVLSGIQLKCPNATEIERFKWAVGNGTINWHAVPMNFQVENVGPELFKFGLKLSQDLDKRFGIRRKGRVMSQRDVPGLTQAAIPILSSFGVKGLSVGVNPMTPPPDVPQIFNWKFNNHSVIATWHKGGYPNNPGPNPANPGGLSREDCVVIPNFPEALCFAFRTDNSGPPINIIEILNYYEILRVQFPSANLKASTFEEYFQLVQPIANRLPVVNKEIGDVWIQGVQSDTRKTQLYRHLTRAFAKCLSAKKCDYTDHRFYNASRFLIKLGEHTWGLNSVFDTIHWRNDQFEAVRKEKKSLIDGELSWIEQKQFVQLTIDALGNHSLAEKIKNNWHGMSAIVPELENYKQIPLTNNEFHCKNNISFKIGEDGSISSLKRFQNEWSNGFGRFYYVTYNETDFNNFGKLFNYNGNSAGYSKLNVTKNAKPESRVWEVSMSDLFVKRAIDKGIYYADERKQSGLLIRSLDVSLVCIETPSHKASVFAAPLNPIDEKITKVAFNIYNNIWDTNYIFWYPYEDSDDDFKSRYSIEFLQ